MEAALAPSATQPTPTTSSASDVRATPHLRSLLAPLVRAALLRTLAHSARCRAEAAEGALDTALREHVTLDPLVLAAQADAVLDHAMVAAATQALVLSTKVTPEMATTLQARIPPPVAPAPAARSPNAPQRLPLPAHAPAAVRSVVLVGKRDHWYAVPEVIIAHTQYATPTTLRVTLPDGSARSVRHSEAVPLPDGDDSRRQHLLDHVAHYGMALSTLADRLRELGSYADRLAEATSALPPDGSGDARLRVPNPLTPTVIVAPVPPRADGRPDVAHDPWQPPTVTRAAVARHTPKMVALGSPAGDPSATMTAQRGHFCCPDDPTWVSCARLVNAAVRAHRAVTTTLMALGTYPPSRATAPLTAP